MCVYIIIATVISWVIFYFTDDNSRVCLSEIPGLVGSDYINASFITVRASLPKVFQNLLSLLTP